MTFRKKIRDTLCPKWKKSSDKFHIFKEGIQDFLVETSLHGLKYLKGGGLLAKLLWVRDKRNFQFLRLEHQMNTS